MSRGFHPANSGPIHAHVLSHNCPCKPVVESFAPSTPIVKRAMRAIRELERKGDTFALRCLRMRLERGPRKP